MVETSICARIPISNDRLSRLHQLPKDQALEKTVLTGLFRPVVYGCFQLVGVTIDSYNRPSRCPKRPTLKSRSARFSAH